MGPKSLRLVCTFASLTLFCRVWLLDIGASTLISVHAYVLLGAQHAPDRSYRGQYGLLAHTAACLLLRLYDRIITRMCPRDDRARARGAPVPVVMIIVRDA